MIIKDRLLFLKYALPCAGTLVKRGNVSKEYVESLVKLVSDGKVPGENAEAMFKVANAMCDKIAKRMEKDSVDSDVIRQYFLLEHSEVVDDRYELMKDFDPVSCKTYAGRVVSCNNGSAVVETRLGKRDYKAAFAKGVKPGDSVVVHWNFIIEKVPEKYASLMGT